MLQLSGINTFHGLSHVLHDVSLEVSPGEIVSLLGRNGAGKTTTLQTIAGLLTPTSGLVQLLGRTLSGLPSFDICRSGVGWVPQGRRVFAELTVEENLRLAVLKLGRHQRQGAIDQSHALFPILRVRGTTMASRLSGGEQQMLAIARALIGQPLVLLMDEPTEGLSPAMVDEVILVIRSIASSGVAVLLAEQNIGMALSVAGRHYIMDKGAICHSASTAELRQRPNVLLSYLGVSPRHPLPGS